MVRVEELTVVSTDGVPLSARCFTPGGLRRGGDAVVIAPATAVPKERYAAFARHLAGRGVSVLTFDYRGIGGSRGRPGQECRFRMREWGECDVAAALDWCARSWAPGRLGYVGHSVGGQLLGLAPNHGLVTAFVGVSAQRGYGPLWRGTPRLLAGFFFRVYIPAAARVLGRVPTPAGDLDGLPRGVALEWARWWRHRPFTDCQYRPLDDRFRAVTVPTLALSFEDDRLLAPRAACDSLFRDYYVNAPVTRVHLNAADYGLPALGHSGIFREPAGRVFWDRLLHWLRTGHWDGSPVGAAGGRRSAGANGQDPANRCRALAEAGTPWRSREVG